MSEVNGSSINYFGSTIQSGYILSQSDEQQRRSYNGIKANRSEGDETARGKKALVNLRMNPAAMSRSINFHETSSRTPQKLVAGNVLTCLGQTKKGAKSHPCPCLQGYKTTSPRQIKQLIHSSKKISGEREVPIMSEMNGSSINYFGSMIQSGYIRSQSDEQRRSYNGVKVYRSEGDETARGKKALVNLRANPAAMSRSINFHETS
ncbi:hypothetical protein LXL04_011464 [Taraxacum kok-saghyz]